MKATQYRNVVIKGSNVTGESTSLGCWCGFSANLPLMFIRHVIDTQPKSLRAVMASANGFGAMGYFPGGYDWSGIRDSTKASQDSMFKVAQRFVRFDDFVAMLEAAAPAGTKSKWTPKQLKKAAIIREALASPALKAAAPKKVSKALVRCSDYNGHKNVLFVMATNDSRFGKDYKLVAHGKLLRRGVFQTVKGQMYDVFADGSAKRMPGIQPGTPAMKKLLKAAAEDGRNKRVWNAVFKTY
jgi:hypothetical protein